MTKEQYDLAINQANIDYDKARRELMKQFAFANNPYKIGDKITDHSCTIEIQKIQAYFSSNSVPICVYTGIQYNKDGKVSKKQDHDTIYQSNIITKP